MCLFLPLHSGADSDLFVGPKCRWSKYSNIQYSAIPDGRALSLGPAWPSWMPQQRSCSLLPALSLGASPLSSPWALTDQRAELQEINRGNKRWEEQIHKGHKPLLPFYLVHFSSCCTKSLWVFSSFSTHLNKLSVLTWLTHFCLPCWALWWILCVSL